MMLIMEDVVVGTLSCCGDVLHFPTNTYSMSVEDEFASCNQTLICL